MLKKKKKVVNGETYELADGSHFADVDLEHTPLRAGDVASDDEQGEDPHQGRESDSSQTSELLHNINRYADETGRADEYVTEDPLMFVKHGGARRAVCLAITIIVLGVWSFALLGYSIVSIREGHDSKTSDADVDAGTNDDVDATSTIADVTDSITSSYIIPTKSIIPLKEYDIHVSREPIPTKAYEGFEFTESLKFIQPPGGLVSKAKDEGLYWEMDTQEYVAKKVSDTNFSSVILDSNVFKYNGLQYTIQSILPSYDLKYAVVVTDYEKIYRHSGLGNYWVYEVEGKQFYPLVDDDLGGKVSYATWSPKFNYVTFVQKNNLYIYDVAKNSIDKVTNDGSDDIFNGKPDWVYEEEVLASDKSIWWSPDERNLVFLRIDDTNVKVQNLELYIRVKDEVYPEVSKLKYPTPGGSNPIVSLKRYEIESKSTVEVDRSDSKLGDDFIVYGLVWLDSEHFIVKETDRTSKLLNHRLVHLHSDTSIITYSINAEKAYNGWIEKLGSILVVPADEASGRKLGYIDTIVVDGYNHLGYFDSADSKEPISLTSGDWEVVGGPLAFDQEEGLVYFSGTRQSAFERHIYSVDINFKALTAMSPLDTLGYFLAYFSPSTRFMILTKDGPEYPSMKLVDSLNEKRGIIDFTGKRKTFHKVEIEKGVTVDVIEYVPYNFDPSNQHPLLVNVYGGPGSQLSVAQFAVDFEAFVSDRLNAVILYIDPRGTGNQGWKYRSWSKGKIGHWESRDIIKATQKWIDSRNYINSNKTAIWGWSYGGFTTLKTLEYDKGETFKFGMAVAPVTNWRFYDSIYTERYMGLPKDNVDGYKEARVNDINAFKSVKRFMIMHGTGDDNVHIQNTFTLLDSFNINGVHNYDLDIFPDSNHNINFHGASEIVQERLVAFLTNAFNGGYETLSY